METTALRFHEFGDPKKVLRLERLSLGKPGRGEVLLRLLASPIHPSDFGMMGGTYGDLPSLPATGGREGVAEVVETGPGVTSLAPGQRVLLPEGRGAWQEKMIARAGALVPVPAEIPLEQAAMATINPPTAWLLLESFVQLQPGDWLIQNAANSAVGHNVVQLCRQRGVRTINIVRRPEWIDRLKNEGADAVLEEGADLPAEVPGITGGNSPRLALNSVGGKSAIDLVKCLGDGGTMVTFGGMTGDPVRFPTRYLIFNDVRLKGFWLHRWKKAHPGQEDELMKTVLKNIARGALRAPVAATFPFTRFAEAIERAMAPGRGGKVLFVNEQM